MVMTEISQVKKSGLNHRALGVMEYEHIGAIAFGYFLL